MKFFSCLRATRGKKKETTKKLNNAERRNVLLLSEFARMVMITFRPPPFVTSKFFSRLGVSFCHFSLSIFPLSVLLSSDYKALVVITRTHARTHARTHTKFTANFLNRNTRKVNKTIPYCFYSSLGCVCVCVCVCV